MTRIKICGITNLADARYAAGAGADYLGFILHPGSPRFVSAELARDIKEWLYGSETVGVFVDVPSDELAEATETAGFDLVQLHGNEAPETCALVEQPVIKAVHIGGSGPAAASSPEELMAVAERYEGAAQYLLLDTARGGLSGGSGQAFDWSIVPDLPLPVFVAGGLTPTNVGEAIRTCLPFAVDTSSGVEEAPGRKDFELIDAFTAAVRAANATEA
ncbi:MAG: phosphoribosylanthranilate isomerase [Rhodothermales bacterium]|nr:phosphoribosylanthranilate isomerase [Rhodothermales bacterium]MBO6779663.1 phosphoribosylanthranilate isomerase [Rhodothermales bacterium]